MRYTTILRSILIALCFIPARGGQAQDLRPNVLWLTSEDNGPQLGCYGDAYADTPNLDALAKKGMIYRNVWSNAPVCAPARTVIISGLMATSTGAEHMRSEVPLPPSFKMYPQFLREAGYYCTNNAKEDYNLTKPGKVWDESSRNGHYKNRKDNQPFFAVFNHEITHESRIRQRPHKLVHDPAKARVPAYHPDTPEVRHDWAQYYDNMTTMDGQVGAKLRELEQAGLADDTIVFYYGDHGSGMPRSKRTATNSGLRVPLIVYVPEKLKHLAPPDYQPGGSSDRLVSFVDLAPTLLSIAGVEPPKWMQGYAFMGKHVAPAPFYLPGFRGRMDERIDLVRSLFDGRYVYVRNYMPHRPHGQHVGYQFQTPTTRIWKELFDAGKFDEAQGAFWKAPRDPEELYDLQNDPDEVKNLAGSPEHQDVLRRMRSVQLRHAIDSRDVGFLPEGEIHDRSRGLSPYEMARDDRKYPLLLLLDAANLASDLATDATETLKALLKVPDSAVRYWAAMGLLMRGEKSFASAKPELTAALKDVSPYVAIPAAEAIARYGSDEESKGALSVLVALADPEKNGPFVATSALNAISYVGPRNAAIIEDVRKLPRRTTAGPQRSREYPTRLIRSLLNESTEEP